MSLIEGHWKEGDRVILIEDLVNQGKSSSFGLQILSEAGIKPLGLFCIVDYEMNAAHREMQQRNCPLYSLTNFSSLIQMAMELNKITAQEYELLGLWHRESQN